MLDITCISDLHGHYPVLEGGDLLIIAGDLTARHTFQEMVDFEKGWLRFQKPKYKKIILIAGNHDFILEELPWEWPGIDYLCDSSTEFEGLKIYGSPWTKSFEGMNPDCMAFTVRTDEELAEKWELIPDDVDILITHSPPYDVGDCVKSVFWRDGGEKIISEFVGSRSLKELLLGRSKKSDKPLTHIFGHIHEGYGKYRLYPELCADDVGKKIWAVDCYNASHVNEHYKPVNKPIRLVL